MKTFLMFVSMFLDILALDFDVALMLLLFQCFVGGISQCNVGPFMPNHR